MTTPPPQDPFATPSGDTPPSSGSSYGPPPSYSSPLPTYDSGPEPASSSSYAAQPVWGTPGAGSPTAPASTDAKAIIALVCAIGSFVLFPVIPAIIALVLAGQSKRDIEASGGRLTGAGLVTAAKVISWVNLVLAVLVVVALVGLFGLFASVGFSEGQSPTF